MVLKQAELSRALGRRWGAPQTALFHTRGRNGRETHTNSFLPTKSCVVLNRRCNVNGQCNIWWSARSWKTSNELCGEEAEAWGGASRLLMTVVTVRNIHCPEVSLGFNPPEKENKIGEREGGSRSWDTFLESSAFGYISKIWGKAFCSQRTGGSGGFTGKSNR